MTWKEVKEMIDRKITEAGLDSACVDVVLEIDGISQQEPRFELSDETPKLVVS